MANVLMVASVERHFGAFHQPYIDLLNKMGHTVDTASHVPLGVSTRTGVRHQFSLPFHRSPWHAQNILVYRQLSHILDQGNYSLVQCNTPVASVLTRLAARKHRSNGLKVMYVAHGFHFFRGAPIVNWATYYPIERALAHITDLIVTINREDYARAQSFRSCAVSYVPGMGVDIHRFASSGADRDTVRRDIGVPSEALLLLSVGEVNENKNHAVIIRALARLKRSDIHYAIAGDGPLLERLRELINRSGLSLNVHLLGFRTDIDALLHSSDIFCFPSRREGLGVSALEAMASGLPLITSNVHGINDYAKQAYDALTIAPNDVAAAAAAIQQFDSDSSMRKAFGERAKEMVSQFDISNTLQCMATQYTRLLGDNEA